MKTDLSAQLETRLEALRQEFEMGQNQALALETKLTELRNTLLRISGAIQVIEEIQQQAPTED